MKLQGTITVITAGQAVIQVQGNTLWVPLTIAPEGKGQPLLDDKPVKAGDTVTVEISK